jgi:2-dehydro-3-deoxygluconokinase
MKPQTVTFGEIMLRLTPPGFERYLQTPNFNATFGGGEANVAVALATLGLNSAYVTVLPENNPIADAAVAELRRFNVDTSKLVRGPGRMGVYYLETGANQRASRVVYDRAGSSAAIAAPGSIDWDKTFDEAGWFHVTGITPAISESSAALALEGVRAARSHAVTVSCDLNFRKLLWKWGKPAPAVMSDLVKFVDVIIANEEDIQMCLGLNAEMDVSSGVLDHRRYEDLTALVLKTYPNLRAVAVTLRESKSASWNRWSACLNTCQHGGNNFLMSRAYDITNIVDRVGSGDSFAGGLIYGMQMLGDDAAALEFAVALSCLKHSTYGDYSRATLAEVNSLLKDGGSGRVQR